LRQSLKELFDLLQGQKSVLENMLELSRQERQVLINGEADRLESIVKQELRELSKLGSLERKRMAVHKTIAAELGLKENELSVSAIAERANPEEKKALVGLQKELTALIGEHTALNNENKELIKTHIEYSETMLELMVGVEDPLNNLYGGDGKAAPDRKKTTGIFDGSA